MSRCVISQPRLFPGLHYLHRLATADVFVILDTVQYNPRHEENRAKLKTAHGTKWITVPMQRSGREQLIMDTKLSDQPWRDKAIRTVESLYGSAPHFDDHIDAVSSVIKGEHQTLTELDVASWGPALAVLGSHAELVYASDLGVDGRASELLVNICRAVGASTYMSGGFGRDYLDTEAFDGAGIELEYHDYNHPEYPQLHGEFVPYLSYLDVVFNTVFDRNLVMRGQGVTGVGESR